MDKKNQQAPPQELINSIIELYSNGQIQEALDSIETLIKDYPNESLLHNISGACYASLGQLDAAVKCYEKAIAIKPDSAEAHDNLGIAYAYNGLGIAIHSLGQLDAAIKCYKNALAIKPDYADAYANRGNVLKDLKRLDEALASYESAIALNPDLDWMLGDSLHTKMNLCIWDDLANRLDELKTKINNKERVISPFPLLALIDDPEIQRKTAEIYANERYPQSHVLSKIERYPKHKKIRIGYFSADFRDHPVSHLTAELYEIHDRNQFEIYGFYFGPDTQDEMNLRIKAGVDHFHDVRMMSYEDTAMLARSVELDIAVDLGGYTQLARTGIFAMSAAPIQISYIGYLGTMGANYYDYLVADQTIIPEKNQKYYSEKIAYLPSYQVNDSTQSLPATIFTRQDVGLPEAGFVFCCFNNTFKIIPSTKANIYFSIWLNYTVILPIWDW